jgi:hypothetical protein
MADFEAPLTPEGGEGNRNTVLIVIAIVVVVLLCCCCLSLYLAWNYGDLFIDALNDLAWRPLLALI